MDDLKLIKEKYGEKMMHLCRTLFPTILEIPGLLFQILSNHFEFDKSLYDDIVEYAMEAEFKDYVYSFIDVERPKYHTVQSPSELLKQAGYTLYECRTEDDIQYFRRYYQPNEELCTFIGGRLERCFVFFAVKDNVNEIKRENFKNPKREDEYGTSVISIQFTRTRPNTLSIKNRYNHVVNNPDATFLNNLDNIISGLTESFEREYGLSINDTNLVDFELPNYVMAKDGKFYRFNYEMNNIYYCPNNIIIDNFEVVRDYQEKEKYLIIDYFIVDLEKKQIRLYDKTIVDSFMDCFKNIIKIDIVKNKENGNKVLSILTSDFGTIKIEINKANKIISYTNESIGEIRTNFLRLNDSMEEINIPNVKKIGNKFLSENNCIRELFLPQVEEIGMDFLYQNEILTTLVAPKLKYVNDNFMYNNHYLEKIDLPELIEASSNFFANNSIIKELNLPKLKKVGHNFLYFNTGIHTVILPKLESAEEAFMYYNVYLKLFDAPSLRQVSHDFLANNDRIEKLNLPNLNSVGMNFLQFNQSIGEINMPNAKLLKDSVPHSIYELVIDEGKVR